MSLKHSNNDRNNFLLYIWYSLPGFSWMLLLYLYWNYSSFNFKNVYEALLGINYFLPAQSFSYWRNLVRISFLYISFQYKSSDVMHYLILPVQFYPSPQIFMEIRINCTFPVLHVPVERRDDFWSTVSFVNPLVQACKLVVPLLFIRPAKLV